MPLKIIVLEGPDGGGKSTLAKHLGNDYGYRVIPMGVPPLEAQKDHNKLFDFFDTPLAEAIGKKQNTVFDRLHLSERIYGPLIRNSTLFTEEEEFVIDYLIQRNWGQVVLCLPPYEHAFKAWSSRKESEYVKNALLFIEVYKKYEKLIGKKYMLYDYTRHHVATFAKALTILEPAP